MSIDCCICLASDCCICLASITQETGIVILSCKHSYHFQCISTWFHKQTESSCPQCLKKMNKEEDIKRNNFENMSIHEVRITEDRLAHRKLIEEIRKEGIKIDKINNIYSIITYTLLSVIIVFMIN